MLPVAKKYFDEHPEAQHCHVVLSNVFATAKEAFAYKKAINARGVTSFSRDDLTPNPSPHSVEGRKEKLKIKKQAKVETKS